MLDATPAVPPSPEVEAASTADASRTVEMSEPTPLRKRLRWPFFTAFLVELVLVLGDRIPSVDSMSYFETGRNFVNGRGYTRSGGPEMHFPPIAPVSFGLLEKAFGNQMYALRTWELFWSLAAVGVLTAVAWFISRDDDTVVATAWIAVTVPGVVTLAIRAGSGSELPVVVMLLASGLLTLLAVDRTSDRSSAKRLGLLVGAGALVGMAYLTRPEALMPGAVIGLAVVLFALRPGQDLGAAAPSARAQLRRLRVRRAAVRRPVRQLHPLEQRVVVAHVQDQGRLDRRLARRRPRRPPRA